MRFAPAGGLRFAPITKEANHDAERRDGLQWLLSTNDIPKAKAFYADTLGLNVDRREWRRST